MALDKDVDQVLSVMRALGRTFLLVDSMHVFWLIEGVFRHSCGDVETEGGCRERTEALASENKFFQGSRWTEKGEPQSGVHPQANS